jgi:hypothetical protein
MRGKQGKGEKERRSGEGGRNEGWDLRYSNTMQADRKW